MKRIAVIMGRGIEGCGVTKFTLEQCAWFAKNGYDYKIFASKDKGWTRSKCHEVDHIKVLKFAKDNEMEEMIKEVATYDLVIINSLPSIGHPEKCIANFEKFLNTCRVHMVLIQHDHSSLSIRRNACIETAIEKSAVIFAHSDDNDFARMVEKQTAAGGLESFFGDEVNEKKCIVFQPGMDFDACREKYWPKDVSVVDRQWNHHKWIGRTTSWKGYVQMFKLHNEFLRAADQVTSFEGIERSPAYLGFIKLSEFNGHVHEPITDVKMELNQPAYVFGPYNNDEMLHRMAKVAFGYQLSVLDQRFIRRSIEYTHCEVACTGVVPVFRAEYGRRVTHRVTGNRMIADPNTGIIWLDDDNMQPAFDRMRFLMANPDEYDRARRAAFEYLKSHQDSRFIFPEMMREINCALVG